MVEEESEDEFDVRLEVSLDGGHTFAPPWTLEEFGRAFVVRRRSEDAGGLPLLRLLPAAVGRPDDFVLGLPGSTAATQNPSLCAGGTLPIWLDGERSNVGGHRAAREGCVARTAGLNFASSGPAI